MLWYQHDWGLYGRRYEMIARTWVEEHAEDRLLLVEPPLNPWIWIRECARAAMMLDGVLLRYWFSNLQLLFSPLQQERERLWVLRPFLWWPFKSVGQSVWTRFSFTTAWAKVDCFLKDHGWENPLLWAYPPHAFVNFGAEQMKHSRLCVDLVDDNTQYESLPKRLREEYKISYTDLSEKADIVFSVSPTWTNRHHAPNKQVIHIPNAVSPQPLSLKRWRLAALPAGPRVCYVGHLDERLDIALLKQIFARLAHVQFIFIGSFDGRTKKIWRHEIGTPPNVHLLGTIPSPHIPSVLASMDVCLLPHRKTPLTESMDPLKLYTYLAANKPVIITGVNIEPSLKPWVKSIDSASMFESTLNDLLNRSIPFSEPDLSQHSWALRIAAMADHLRKPIRVTESFPLVISIVHYNTPELLRSCLDAFYQEGSPIRRKIVVVDNASTPPLRPEDFAHYPDLSVITNSKNVGFGSANNQVFRQWKGDWYLVTNPDVKPAPGSLEPLLRQAASRSRLGAKGVRLRYPDGRPQSSCSAISHHAQRSVRGFLPGGQSCPFPIHPTLPHDGIGDSNAHVRGLDAGILPSASRASPETGGWIRRRFLHVLRGYRFMFPVTESWLAGGIQTSAIRGEHDYRRESTRSVS